MTQWCSQIKDYAAELVEPNHAPLSAILRPEDEIQLWSDLAASSTCPAPLKQRAAAISALLAPILPKLFALRKSTGEMPAEEVLDLIDELHQTLEALWELQDTAAAGYCLESLLIWPMLCLSDLRAGAAQYIAAAVEYGYDMCVS